MGLRRRGFLVAALVLAAVALLVAGTLTWRMSSRESDCPVTLPRLGIVCESVPVAPHRLHPLRAKLLWGGGTALAGAALAVGLSARRRSRGVARPAGC